VILSSCFRPSCRCRYRGYRLRLYRGRGSRSFAIIPVCRRRILMYLMIWGPFHGHCRSGGFRQPSYGDNAFVLHPSSSGEAAHCRSSHAQYKHPPHNVESQMVYQSQQKDSVGSPLKDASCFEHSRWCLRLPLRLLKRRRSCPKVSTHTALSPNDRRVKCSIFYSFCELAILYFQVNSKGYHDP
jgi:hypothetical protein